MKTVELTVEDFIKKNKIYFCNRTEVHKFYSFMSVTQVNKIKYELKNWKWGKTIQGIKPLGISRNSDNVYIVKLNDSGTVNFIKILEV